jgi:DNA-binding NtrC family response regulator
MPTTKQAANKAKKVLIVEDEADICLLLNIILKDDEVEVEHVKNLANARDFLAANQPSVVLLDHKLPDGHGLDFIEFIRVNYPAIKIIMLTGYKPSTPREIALSDNADVFLEKPFTRTQVYDSVKSLLN